MSEQECLHEFESVGPNGSIKGSGDAVDYAMDGRTSLLVIPFYFFKTYRCRNCLETFVATDDLREGVKVSIGFEPTPSSSG